MRTETTKVIYQAALKNKNIIFLTGDLDHEPAKDFQQNIPNQHINVGLAEQNMIGIAAGLALSGKKVFVFSITPFVTMRCFEQIRVDVCYQNLDVTIIGVGAGFAYSTSGPTHHTIEDIAIMRALPNMKIFSPCHPLEARLITEMLLYSPDLWLRGPNYLRLGRKNDPLIPELAEETLAQVESLGAIEVGRLTHYDMTIFSTGSIITEAISVAKELKKFGWGVEVLNIHVIKPFTAIGTVQERMASRKAIFTLEEHSINGGLGSTVSEIIAETGSCGKPPIFKRFGVEDKFTHIVGSVKTLRKENKIDFVSITEEILHLMRC